MWYAASPGRLARQVLTDLVVATWVVLWTQTGRWVYDLVCTLAEPAQELRDAGTSIGTGLRSAGDQVSNLPLLGEQLSGTFRQLAGAGDQVGDAGTSLTATSYQLAMTLGLITALGPILSLVIPWLILRTRFARRNRAARLLAHGPSGDIRRYDVPNLELFALRALAHQPLTALVRIHPDPVGAWRQGDPVVTEDLARLELRSAGLGLPRRLPPRVNPG